MNHDRRSKVASSASDLPDLEVKAEGKRRIFSASDKKKILAEADAAAGPGNIGGLLRRESILLLDSDKGG